MQQQVTVTLVPTIMLQWLSSIYVMCVTSYTAEHIRVKTLASFAVPRPPVPNFSHGIVIHATGHFLVTSVTKMV